MIETGFSSTESTLNLNAQQISGPVRNILYSGNQRRTLKSPLQLCGIHGFPKRLHLPVGWGYKI